MFSRTRDTLEKDGLQAIMDLEQERGAPHDRFPPPAPSTASARELHMQERQQAQNILSTEDVSPARIASLTAKSIACKTSSGETTWRLPNFKSRSDPTATTIALSKRFGQGNCDFCSRFTASTLTGTFGVAVHLKLIQKMLHAAS